MKKFNGRRLAALLLIAGFTMTLAVVANAEPLRPGVATQAATAKKALPHHYLGKVTSVNPTNQTFTLDIGTKKVVVATTSATKFQTYAGGKKTAAFTDIKIDGKVAVIGDLKGSTLTAKIVFIVPVKTTHRHADRGTISALSGSGFTYTPTANKNSTGTALVTSGTVFTKKQNGKIVHVSFSSLSIGDRVTFVGTISDGGVITAKLVHIIPGTPASSTATSSAR